MEDHLLLLIFLLQLHFQLAELLAQRADAGIGYKSSTRQTPRGRDPLEDGVGEVEFMAPRPVPQRLT